MHGLHSTHVLSVGQALDATAALSLEEDQLRVARLLGRAMLQTLAELRCFPALEGQRVHRPPPPRDSLWRSSSARPACPTAAVPRDVPAGFLIVPQAEFRHLACSEL